MKKKIINSLFSKSALWLILLLCFYYPIAASLISIFNLPSTIVNTIIRAILAGIALILVFFGYISKKSIFTLNLGQLLLILFWIIYGFRLVYDLQNGITFESYKNYTVYGFAFGNILLPIFAIILWGKNINIKNVSSKLFGLFLIINTGIIFAIYSKTSSFDFTLFTQRLSVDTDANNSDGSVLNPITISFCGSLLTITTLYFLLFKEFKYKFLLLIPLLLGIAVLFFGASRGPLFGCIFTIMLLIISKYNRSLKKKIFIIKTVSIIILLNILVPLTIGNFISNEEIVLVSRVNEFYDDRTTNETEERDILIQKALEDFYDSPIIGKQFVLTYNNFYPHNIFVEVLMATGLIGSLFFFGFFISLLKKCYFLFFSEDSEKLLIFLIFIPILIGTLFSGSLFMSTDIWAMGTFILCIKPDDK